MRVFIKDSKAFFKEILLKNHLSLIKLAKVVNCNYSTLKKYTRGEISIPEETFQKMRELSQNKKSWNKKISMQADNWGKIKGGSNYALRKDVKKRIAHARKFKKRTDVNINLDPLFCEFYGMLLGDGCISKFIDYEGVNRIAIYISGNKKLDSNYLKDWKIRLKKEYGLYCYYYEHKKRNVCNLIIKNKGLCLNINKKFEFPIGIKYNSLKISNKILKLPWDIKKFVIRGLFDTDGCLFARKDENFKYPHISISSKSESFLIQIKTLLRAQAYPAYISNTNVIIKGKQNIERWFKDIGSSNQRNLGKYKYFNKYGFLPSRINGLVV